MNYQEVFLDCAKYPFTDFKRLLIFIILFFGSFLVIPGLLVYGYLWKVLESSLKGEKSLPKFDKWGQMLTRGVKLVIISLIYIIPFSLISLFLGDLFSILIKTNIESININFVFLGIYTSTLNVLIFSVLGFMVFFILAMTCVNMVYENRFISAFDFKRIFHLIKHVGLKKYALFISSYILVVLIIYAGSIIISNLSYEMSYLAVFVQFMLIGYSIIFLGRLFGLIYPLVKDKMLNDN